MEVASKKEIVGEIWEEWALTYGRNGAGGEWRFIF